MTSSDVGGDRPSEGTLSCLTGAIMEREGARAVGSTFAREWEPDPAPRLPTPPPTPSSLRALPVLPTASVPAAPRVVLPVVPVRARRPAMPLRARVHREVPVRPAFLHWSPVGAFALGATLAALAGVGLERGALEFAALASAVAGGVTLAAALPRAARKRRADRDRD